MTELIEVELSRLVLRAKSDQQYVHLRVVASDRTFPILIGFCEAAEIHRKLLHRTVPRPMTHDLIVRVLQATDWALTRVVINALNDGTFYAFAEMTHGAEAKLVDCRPSDALALAVQTKVPIFVAQSVLDEVAPE